MIKCPKCNKEIEDNTYFCPHCGTKIHRKIDTSSDNKITYNFVFIIAFSLLALLMFVGMFGEIIRISGETNNGEFASYSELPIKYFYGYSYKALLKSKGLNEYPFRLVVFIIENIIYFGGLLGLMTSIVFMAINFFKVAKDNKEIKLLPIYGLLISVLPYVFLMSIESFRFAVTDRIVFRYYGWGPILIIVGCLGAAAALLAFNILKSNKTKTDIFNVVLKGIIPIILISMVVFCLWGDTLGILLRPVAPKVNSYTYNPMDIAYTYYKNYSSAEMPKNVNNALAGLIMVSISGLLFISSLFSIYKKKTLITTLIISVALAVFVVGSIYSCIAYKNYGVLTKYQIGGPAIAAYVLGGLAIVALITSLVIQRKQKEA